MDDEVLERNKNLNRGFPKLRVWREDIGGQRSDANERIGRFKQISCKIESIGIFLEGLSTLV